MEFSKEQRIIEAILFSAGREVSSKELMNVLEISEEDIEKVIQNMKSKYEENGSALEIIKVDNSYQLCTKKEMYEYIYPIIDNRTKPTISNAALETLSIIAYNPKITRSEIESIRGVSVDGTIYKLLEYNLIEDAGKLDAPGRPTTYKMFGISSLDELPELPRYKLDENEQIVIDDMLKENETIEETIEENLEAPMPAREDIESQKKESNED